MKYVFRIRNNATGEVREYNEDYDWKDEEGEEAGERHMLFQWGENNYACDCNRSLFFARAAGEDEPETECGSELYTVIEAISEDGRVIPVDAP